METLPKEIIDIILEFQGYHKWRNGKFIPRLDTQNEKYDKLKSLSFTKQRTSCSYIGCSFLNETEKEPLCTINGIFYLLWSYILHI